MADTTSAKKVPDQAAAILASDPEPGTAKAALKEQLEADPTGKVSGNKITYPDGAVFVAAAVTTYSLSSCYGGAFCAWSSDYYSGGVQIKTGTGVKGLSGDTESFWNNRSYVANFYNNSGTAAICYENGVRKATVSGSYASSAAVNLRTSTNC